MKLLRSYPLLSFLLVLLSIGGFCLAQRSLGLLIIAGTLAVASWFVTEGPRGRTIPAWLSHLLVLAASIGVLIDWYQHQSDWIGVLGRYAVWLSVIKLFEARMPRDHGQLLAFSLMLMVMGTLRSADLLFSAVLLTYAALGLYVLLLHQVHSAYEREKARRAAAVPRGYRLAPMLKPVIGQRVSVQFRLTALAIGGAGMFLSVLLFLAVPRGLGEEAVPGLPTASQRRAAYLNEVTLGAGSRITDSGRPVMRVQIVDEDGRALRDPPYLLRGAAMEMYMGDGQWRPVITQPRLIDTDIGEFAPLAEGVEPSTGTIIQRCRLDMPLDVLPSLATVVALTTSSGATVAFDPRSAIIRRPEQGGRVNSYEIRSQTSPSRATLRALLGGERVFWSTHRYRNRDVRQLAEALLEARRLDRRRPNDTREASLWARQAAAAFRDYLAAADFTYTTDLSDITVPEEGSDHIEQFLLKTKRGHCEYFASAMAGLCHTVGIQARLVTGFVAYEYDDAAREFVVLERNAHAWVEVLTDPEHWETYDPTPPAVLRERHDIEPGLPDRMQRFMSRLESGFGSRFLDFDQQDQVGLARALDMGWSERLGALWEAMRDWARRVNRSFRLGWAGYAWMGIVALALVIAVIALIKLMRRSLQLRRILRLHSIHGAEYQRMLRQLGFYLDMLYVLRRAGFEKPPWQPPMHYAEELAASRPASGAAVRRITRLFYEARYGRRPLRRAEVQRARADVTTLAADLGVRL